MIIEMSYNKHESLIKYCYISLHAVFRFSLHACGECLVFLTNLNELPKLVNFSNSVISCDCCYQRLFSFIRASGLHKLRSCHYLAAGCLRVCANIQLICFSPHKLLNYVWKGLKSTVNFFFFVF